MQAAFSEHKSVYEYILQADIETKGGFRVEGQLVRP